MPAATASSLVMAVRRKTAELWHSHNKAIQQECLSWTRDWQERHLDRWRPVVLRKKLNQVQLVLCIRMHYSDRASPCCVKQSPTEKKGKGCIFISGSETRPERGLTYHFAAEVRSGLQLSADPPPSDSVPRVPGIGSHSLYNDGNSFLLNRSVIIVKLLEWRLSN